MMKTLVAYNMESARHGESHRVMQRDPKPQPVYIEQAGRSISLDRPPEIEDSPPIAKAPYQGILFTSHDRHKQTLLAIELNLAQIKSECAVIVCDNSRGRWHGELCPEDYSNVADFDAEVFAAAGGRPVAFVRLPPKDKQLGEKDLINAGIGIAASMNCGLCVKITGICISKLNLMQWAAGIGDFTFLCDSISVRDYSTRIFAFRPKEVAACPFTSLIEGPHSDGYYETCFSETVKEANLAVKVSELKSSHLLLDRGSRQSHEFMRPAILQMLETLSVAGSRRWIDRFIGGDIYFQKGFNGKP